MRRAISLLPLIALAGCTSMSCGTDDEKLARLKPGMTRDEMSTMLGCPGTPVSESGKSPGRFTTVVWNGPGSLAMARTYVVFLDDRLYNYTIEKRGGF